ncbi:MAG: IS1380 family transposase [Candidatus Aminicenantes bacterium]|nr:IS1380 family transposase [Candidatus Aminicenantes bacterium]
MKHTKGERLNIHFNRKIKLEFHGARLTSDGGLLAYRELDDTLGLFNSASTVMSDKRTGRNIQHDMTNLLRQSVYTRLAGYEDVNDAQCLSFDLVMRAVTGKKKNAAGINTIGRLETEILIVRENIDSLSEINGRWVERAMEKTAHHRIVLDMDSSESPVHGEQEGSAYNGHFKCNCYHPLFCFNQYGDCEGAMLRPGNVHSADRWKEMLEPIVRRYENKKRRKYFRGDAAFAKPEVYEYLEEKGLLYAIRLPANDVLYDEIKHLLIRPVGRPSRKPVVCFHDFKYRAASWHKRRRVVAKVEWLQGDLFPRVGFILTNMSAKAVSVVRFYNGRGIAEQWIKEGKYALNWTRLSCKHFLSNQVRLGLFVLAYNLGNFLWRLVLPGKIKHWSLRTLLMKLIKIGAKVLRHSRYVIFQMAEVAISKELFAEILSRISRLRCCSQQ